MHLSEDLLQPLLTGLSDRDQSRLLSRIELARDEQLDRKRNPPRRRRRDADGQLVWHEDSCSDAPSQGPGLAAEVASHG